jgi:hypothetical protein
MFIVCLKLAVSLDCPFLIDPTVFLTIILCTVLCVYYIYLCRIVLNIYDGPCVAFVMLKVYIPTMHAQSNRGAKIAMFFEAMRRYHNVICIADT